MLSEDRSGSVRGKRPSGNQEKASEETGGSVKHLPRPECRAQVRGVLVYKNVLATLPTSPKSQSIEVRVWLGLWRGRSAGWCKKGEAGHIPTSCRRGLAYGWPQLGEEDVD